MTPRRTFLALLCAVPGLALMAGCDGGNPKPPAGGFKGVVLASKWANFEPSIHNFGAADARRRLSLIRAQQ